MGFELGGVVLGDLFGAGAADAAVADVGGSLLADSAITAGTEFGMTDAAFTGLSDIPAMTGAAGGGLSGAGGMIGGLGQLAGGLYGAQQGNAIRGAAKGIDPFGPYRSGFAQQLQQLMANPSSVTKQPGYEAGMKASEQSLTRNLASQGLTGSGTAAQSLTEFGAKYQDTAFQQLFQQLSGLSGAGFNNAGAAVQAQAGGYNTTNSAIGNLAKAIPGLMGGGN